VSRRILRSLRPTVLIALATGSACFSEDGDGASSTPAGDASAADTSESSEGTLPSTATTTSVDTTAATGDGTPDSTSAAESSDSGGTPMCGDGALDNGEECDDGNDIATDACLGDCIAARCGDSIVRDGVEACDDGLNDGSYGGCQPGCEQLASYCGDGTMQIEEQCEPGSVLAGTSFVCSAACVYDFSSVPQLYWHGACSYAGPPDCDEMDANVYCRLITGDPGSVASSYALLPALDDVGFSCVDMGTNLGPMPLLGVPGDVWYQDSSLQANHGGGLAVMNVVCR
jgi:cysteine-rich repeat protein